MKHHRIIICLNLNCTKNKQKTKKQQQTNKQHIHPPKKQTNKQIKQHSTYNNIKVL